MQVARQEGEYLARLLKQHNPGTQSEEEGPRALPNPQKPFKYTHLGSLAYVGADKAVMDIPKMGPVTGWTAGAPAPRSPPCQPLTPTHHGVGGTEAGVRLGSCCKPVSCWELSSLLAAVVVAGVISNGIIAMQCMAMLLLFLLLLSHH